MKKRIGIAALLAILVCLCLTGCAKSRADAVATVNGVAITQEQVIARMRFNAIQNQAFRETFRAAFSDPQERENALALVEKPVDQAGVLQELIEAEVLRQDLIKRNAGMTREETDLAARREFDLLKTDPSQHPFYDHLRDALRDFGVEEDAYLTMLEESAYDAYNHELWEANKLEGPQLTSEQVQAMIEQLIERAEIVR